MCHFKIVIFFIVFFFIYSYAMLKNLKILSSSELVLKYTMVGNKKEKNISQEQKDLADFIKEVHLSLRCRAREIGPNNAWREHLQNEKVLKEYAKSMWKLSENYWYFNNKSSTETLQCRNYWMANYIIDYFKNDGFIKEMEKERSKMNLFFKSDLITAGDLESFYQSGKQNLPKSPFKLLDVGSCYNPLKKFDFLRVYPIDLYPANKEVKKCDFINVQITTEKHENWFDSDEVISVPHEYFDVVVFSLLLEYLPSPEQRYLSCKKAYSLLKPNGLLLVVTPDSKHATANARIMKSWKIAAASIGFNRTKLEKLKYLYCMAFRKSIYPKYALKLYKMSAINFCPQNMFVIPQDSINYNVKKTISNALEKSENVESMKKNLMELPFFSNSVVDV